MAAAITRPPPNDEELRWKSRARQRMNYSDDDDDDDDDEYGVPADDYDDELLSTSSISHGAHGAHGGAAIGGASAAIDYRRSLVAAIEKPTMNHYVSDGGGGNNEISRQQRKSTTTTTTNGRRFDGGEGETEGDGAMRSQSILSNVGTESQSSTSQLTAKDSGLGGFSSDQLSLVLLSHRQTQMNSTSTGAGAGAGSGQVPRMTSDDGDETETGADRPASVVLVEQQQEAPSSSSSSLRQSKQQNDHEETTSEAVVDESISQEPQQSNSKTKQFAAGRLTKPFQLRRTKSEKSNGSMLMADGRATGSRIPVSVVRAAQIKTRKYFHFLIKIAS